MRFRPALLSFACAASVVLAPGVARAGSSPPRMVVHISSYTQFGPSQLTASGSRVFFAMDDGPSNTHGTEPWVSDGTAAGTHMIADVVPGTDGSTPSCFVDVKG